MAHLKLDKALTEIAGVRKDGAAYLLSEELDVTLYANLGEEILQIARVSRLEPGADLIGVFTHKGERFFLPPECIVALKTGVPAKAAGGAAGFRA